MRYIDLTGTIENGMWDYGKPFTPPQIEEVASIEKDGYSAHKITISVLSGTYIETGSHMVSGMPTIDEIHVEEFIKEAVIIKTPEIKNAGEHVTVEDLEANNPQIKPKDALLVSTGWDRMWNKDGYVLDSPHFTSEAMGWILDKKISLLGGDMPCFDDLRECLKTKEFPNLHKFYPSGALLLAPVVNLRQITSPRVKLIALPPKVKGVCATPCRAIVIEE